MVESLDRRSRRRSILTPIAPAVAVTPALAGNAHAALPVPLGTADSFALLAGSTITNTGPTTITGDIGLCCTGLATPGFGSVTQIGGAQYAGPGTVAETAQNDLGIAYANAAGQPVASTLPVDLSLSGTPATPLRPGVYDSTAHGALQINTGLTLDFQGNPNAVFVLQGTTMALGASVLGTGATVHGRILTRRSKAVTLDTNTITRFTCPTAAPTGDGQPTTTTPGPTTPSPSTTAPTTTTTPPTTGSAAAPAATGSTPSSPAATAPAAVGQPLVPASPAAASPGTARLVGPRGRVSRPFTVYVTGRAIQTVRFYVGGRRIGIVQTRAGRTRFGLTINPLGQSSRVSHRVMARITFTSASRTPTAIRRLSYRTVSAPTRAPRFTG